MKKITFWLFLFSVGTNIWPQAMGTEPRFAKKPLKLGFTLGMNYGLYFGEGDDLLHITNFSYGLSVAYEIDSLWWLNLGLIKDNQLSLQKAGQDSSTLCQNSFAKNLLKFPGRCGSLIWRADIFYTLEKFEIGAGLASHNHGGFTFFEDDLLNSHYKQVTLSLLASKRLRIDGTYITPIFRLEKSIYFSSAIDDDVSSSSWLFSLEIYFHWSIL